MSTIDCRLATESRPSTMCFPLPFPTRGRILTQISNFWFDRLPTWSRTISSTPTLVRSVPELDWYYDELNGRTVLVRSTRPLVIEAIVRGYLSGSGWKEYQQLGTVCAIRPTEGLTESDRLPEAIFTPSTKARSGHDENISFESGGRFGWNRHSRAGARTQSDLIDSLPITHSREDLSLPTPSSNSAP
jgi:phosphoribosylaminoimidazole-succinocarboxamide synthase